MIFISLTLYFVVIFSVMELIRSGELLHKATEKKKMENTKLKKLHTEQKVSPHDRNIDSKFYI